MLGRDVTALYGRLALLWRALAWLRFALVLPCLLLLACIDVWRYPRRPKL
jgi:hypothetical protein